MGKNIILSGMRPTGTFHFGNYFGALENWINLQEQYTCYFFVADWHALTTTYQDTSLIKNNTIEMIIDWVSAGLDPNKCTIFLQSDIKQIAELQLLLSMITPLSWLFRCPTYKDQLNQIKERDIATYGFLGYPCLQAADILMFMTNFVPVGADQIPHVELVREIARKFNFTYGETFVEPQCMLTESKILPGLDGRKMSKSYNNAIYLSDSPNIIREKVRMMITDPNRIRKTDLGNPDVCTVYAFCKLFDSKNFKCIQENCKAGKIGCVQCKKNLAENIIDYMAPTYERRLKLQQEPDTIIDIIRTGGKKATTAAEETIEQVRATMKLHS